MVLHRPQPIDGRRREDLRKQVATYPLSRNTLVDQLSRRKSACRQSTGKAEALRVKLARGEIKAPTDIDEDVLSRERCRLSRRQ